MAVPTEHIEPAGRSAGQPGAGTRELIGVADPGGAMHEAHTAHEATTEIRCPEPGVTEVVLAASTISAAPTSFRTPWARH